MRGDVIRRLLDVSIALPASVLLVPVLVVIAVLIKLDSPGPVLHRPQRIGKDGRPFRLCKFRTMVVGADRNGPGITVADDPRITRVGRLLRDGKLDELPQIFNVFKGEMSIVGPRPEDPRYVALYTPAQREVLRVRPGITSAASLIYLNESALLSVEDSEEQYVQTILPRKLAIELEYLANRTLATDFGLVIRTMVAICRQTRSTS